MSKMSKLSKQVKLHMALIQVQNLLKLTDNGQYTGFMTSHLLPVKYELERQLHCLTGYNKYAKVQESKTN